MRLSSQVKNKAHALLTKNGILQPFTDLFGRAGRKWFSHLELRPVYRQSLDTQLRVLDALSDEVKQSTVGT
jgi:hypothetical protein